MTDDRLVGKLLGAVARLEKRDKAREKRDEELHAIVKELHQQVMRMRYQLRHLPCMKRNKDEDTCPECPAVLSEHPMPELLDAGDDESDSALLRQMEFRASKSSFSAKGPSIMVFALGALLGAVVFACIFVFAWFKFRIGT